MAKGKSKKKTGRSRKKGAAPPKLLVRPTIRSLSVAAQPICVTASESSLKGTQTALDDCSGCFGFTGGRSDPLTAPESSPIGTQTALDDCSGCFGFTGGRSGPSTTLESSLTGTRTALGDCSGCFGFAPPPPDQPQAEQFIAIDMERFVPELGEGVKLRCDRDQPLLFDEKTRRTYVLNSGALAMVELINGSRSAKKIAKRLLKEYCVAEDALMVDLEALLKTLSTLRLLRTG